ncbi:MAG: hypothetical protein ACXW3D_00100 [Caulobacteraceae bacterium]
MTARLSLAALTTSLLALAVACPADAARRIYSYDPVNDPAKVLSEGGFTFVFEDKMMRGQRVTKVLASQAEAEALLAPAGEGELGAGMEALAGRKLAAHDLYRIRPEENGEALGRAACPGSAQTWLAFDSFERNTGLTVEVFGKDPGAAAARHCATLEFAWRGEWKLPSDPARMRPKFDPVPTSTLR